MVFYSVRCIAGSFWITYVRLRWWEGGHTSGIFKGDVELRAAPVMGFNV